MAMQATRSPASWLTCTDGLAAQWQDFLLLLGRAPLGWIFILSGWRKLMDIPAFVATMPRWTCPPSLGMSPPSSSSSAGFCSWSGSLPATRR